RGLRRQIFQRQRRYRIEAPVWLEYDFTGLIEQWALGMEWKTLCENTSLDEGDIVRILRRTLDFLSQIPHVPHLSDEFRKNARRAGHLIDRFPVNETMITPPDSVNAVEESSTSDPAEANSTEAKDLDSTIVTIDG
ncbi:MAG: hypothetical protein F6K16_36495, partial [Symploca sp. SIO2B6]|nr:hypothetical protein [Symploca sp. SIO2B6]